MKTALLTICLAALVLLGIIGVRKWQRRMAAIDAEVGACCTCLPDGLTLDTEFGASSETISLRGDRRLTTVRAELIKLEARCVGGRIYDSRGREIRFHGALEYGPNPGREKMEKDRRELEELERHYTVILMYAKVAPC